MAALTRKGLQAAVCYRLNWWDPDQRRRGMGAQELYGMRTAHVARLLADTGFRDFHQHRFLYGLNNLYIARK